MDRVEIRRRNLILPSEIPYKNWRGLMIDSGDFPALLDETARRADWMGFENRRQETLTRGKRRGRGVSFYFEASGGPPGPEPSAIRFKDDGTVEVSLATQTNGQGHDTTFAQIVHEMLGVPFDKIVIKQGDTDDGMSGGGTVGSRSVQTAGNAIHIAAGKVVAKGKEAAARTCCRRLVPMSDLWSLMVLAGFKSPTAREKSRYLDLATTLRRDPNSRFRQRARRCGRFPDRRRPFPMAAPYL